MFHKALTYVSKQRQSKLRRLLSKHEALFSANQHALLQQLLHAACVQPTGAPITRMLLRCVLSLYACIKTTQQTTRRGARADVASATGRTPAHVAAAAGCLEVLAVLMAHDSAPDLDALDATGRTVFSYTAEAMESRPSSDAAHGAPRATATADDGWADKLAGACSDPELHERYV